MSTLIVIDLPTLKECVESNIYQSLQFEAGERLAKGLLDPSINSISPRVTPVRHKDTLYLLQSRTETGYLVIDTVIFNEYHLGLHDDAALEDRLLRFQRTCRFALKHWAGLSFSFTERWSQKTGCGVVFPYPKSKQHGFRISLNLGAADRRQTARHGNKQLFAFAAGLVESSAPSPDQERQYKRALEHLSEVRLQIEPQIAKIETQTPDIGYRPLVLAESPSSHFKFQEYDAWVSRLTKQQKEFVTSTTVGPQRVEGPAGTGKTLSLLLRSFFLCKSAEANMLDFRLLFICHGEETRKTTAAAFDYLGEPLFHHRDRNHYLQNIEVNTLQQWCGALLGSQEIADSQYLDQDALQAKELRKLILKDIVTSRLSNDAKAMDYLSAPCSDFFKNENIDYVVDLLQHEIGVMIKGRAGEKLETYISLPALAYCLPARTSNDRSFVFSIYKDYQSQLNQSGSYDTDDITLSALGRLNTPIWRRRRTTEGYDAIAIDETHLFNFNELAVFHHLLKDPSHPRIIFSIDRSQAPGERGITTRLVREALTNSPEEETRINLVFRSSPEIVKLAEAITYAGASLFTTFENPLVGASAVISASDELAARTPTYWETATDLEMLQFAARRASELSDELKCPPNDILLIAMSEDLLSGIGAALTKQGSRHVTILHRGDLSVVKKGERDHAFVVSLPDYVGGLEFKAVLVVGVDEGRVPPTEGLVKEESRHFVEFRACNKLYVAVSRARLAAELFYSAERGKSPLLAHALSIDALQLKSAEIT